MKMSFALLFSPKHSNDRKRVLLLLGFSLLATFGFSQHADSLAAVQQVDSLIQVSRTLSGQGNFDKAFEVNAAAEKIALEKLGRGSVAYGNCCSNHGATAYYKRDYPEAEKWFLEALAIREKTLGKKHLSYANSLFNLANLYRRMENNEKAELFFLETLTIREKTLGKEHPDFVLTLNNLGVVYANMGNYEKAERIHLEVRDIWEKKLGKESSEYTMPLVNLAYAYVQMGYYEKAEPLYLEAISIQEKVLGKEHPDYAASLNNLGVLYMNIGNYKKAEQLFLEAKNIREKALGKKHPNYLASLNNLALLYWYSSVNYEKAESLYLEALAIGDEVLGKDNRDYAGSLINLANLYRDMGSSEKAEPLYLEAKNILEKVLEKKHPDYAGSLNNLANLYFDRANYEKAEMLYLEAHSIWEKALGKEHPTCVASLNNLANLCAGLGQQEKAELFYTELEHLNQTLITRALHHLSERELNNYLNTFSRSQAQMFSFAQIPANKNSPFLQVCYDNSLFYKGFLLNAANQIKRLALFDSATTEKFNRLKGFERRLATQYALPIVERKGVEELEEKANALEKELTRTVAGYAEAIQQVKWQEVQKQLKPDEAAVEFVHYRFYKKIITDSINYAALILRPLPAGDVSKAGSDTHPQFIPLFEEKSLQSLMGETPVRRMDYVANLYQSSPARGIEPVNTSKKSLYELIWAPLQSALKDVKTVYYAPSGILHRLNMSAIAVNEDSLLTDRYELVRLGSTRSLAEGTKARQLVSAPAVIPSADKPATATVYGGIRFEMDSTAIGAANAGWNTDMATNRGGLSFAYADSTLRGGTWEYLKWTEKEATAVASILTDAGIPTEIWKGYLATEESIKRIGKDKPSPRILHISTHGYFFPDPKENENSRPSTLDQEPIFKISDHPMIRSGLILAGANHAWQTGKPLKPDMDDGILTAYEISQMNLTGTELVVLSACETGLGDIAGNEGVYGLQRAFKIAGVRNLIMSLWQVPDFQTKELMSAFYRNWLKEQLSIREALEAAQQEMRNKGFEPYYWAGFVLVE